MVAGLTHGSTGPRAIEGVTHMGRGRQKAKYTKVARELKYNVPETNYEQLQRELQGSRTEHEEDELSKWSDYLDDENEDEGTEEDHDQRRLA